MSQQPTSIKDWIKHPRRQNGMKIREAVESGIHQFFSDQSYRRVQTPVVVPSPGLEAYIRPFLVQPYGEELEVPLFLQTSPEIAMKKLLIGGMEKIYQIAPVFRSEPIASTHLPEFSMLEWYETGATHIDLMNHCEKLIESLASAIGLPLEAVPYGNSRINFTGPWPRLTIRSLFSEFAKLELTSKTARDELLATSQKLGCGGTDSETWDDLFFRIWLNEIEPKLPKDRPCFVTEYPVQLSANAKHSVDPDGNPVADRFEIFAGGLELANAFHEMTSSTVQRKQYDHESEIRRRQFSEKNFPATPYDENFLTALENERLPDCAGIALGVDRLCMILANESEIQFLQWLPPPSV